MINLNKIIKKNKNYINYWSIFSRLLLLKEELLSNSSFLIVVENEKILNSYLKISKYLGISLFSLENISDYVNISYNNIWRYITTKDFYNIDIDDIKQFEYKELLKIEKSENIQIQDLTKKLWDLWYSFSNYNTKNSFNITWDILSITNDYLKTIKVSFWWNIIDSIMDWNIDLNKFLSYFLG
mgnify:FL=1